MATRPYTPLWSGDQPNSVTGLIMDRLSQNILTGSQELLKAYPGTGMAVPSESSPEVQEAILKERMLLQRKKGRSSTILTNNLSATEPLAKVLG